MKRGIRFITLGVLLVLSMFLTACGTSGGGSADAGEKVYVVGTDATYAPMEYMDDKGNIVGIDIEIVKAIADAAGIKVEFKNYGWEPLFSAVKNEEVDFAVSSITITEDRQKEFDFTDPYFIANQLILAPEDSPIETFEDLKGKKVSVQINTTGHTVVKGLLGNSSANILATETMPLAIQEMVIGNADASVGDNFVILDYQKNNPNVKLKTINDDAFEKEYYGLMVKKGNTELVDILNEGIQKIKENGKLEELAGFKVE